MKILLSGWHNPHFMTITEYMERAITNLGHDLASFDDRQFVLPGRLRDRFSSLGRFELAGLNRKLVREADRVLPLDLLLVTGGHRISAETVGEFSKRGVKTALWTIDAPRDFQPIVERAPSYDRIFCGGTEAVELLEETGVKGARWLPFGCDPGIHCPVTVTPEESDRYGHDVTFVGSFYPNRAEVMEELADFDIGIWGPGWQTLPESSPLKKHVKGGELKPDEWKRIFCSSKMVLVVHYRDPQGRIPCYQASPKVYESLACGAFTIVDDQKDVLSLFESRKHLVRYRDIGELRELIRYYLARPGERREIARRGREEVLKKHTYEHRMERMLKLTRTQKIQTDEKV